RSSSWWPTRRFTLDLDGSTRSWDWIPRDVEAPAPNSKEPHMTPTPHSRRDVLKGAVAITAAASVGLGRADAQESAMQARTRIDGVLKQAVDAKEVPGVVAMAATDKGVLYEGAFGTRDLAKGPAMTLDTVFRIASMTKADTCTAAMQLVEQGRLKIDEPVPSIDPALSAPQVLEGFDAAGAPKLRPAKRPSSGRARPACTSARPTARSFRSRWRRRSPRSSMPAAAASTRRGAITSRFSRCCCTTAASTAPAS